MCTGPRTDADVRHNVRVESPVSVPVPASHYRLVKTRLFHWRRRFPRHRVLPGTLNGRPIRARWQYWELTKRRVVQFTGHTYQTRPRPHEPAPRPGPPQQRTCDSASKTHVNLKRQQVHEKNLQGPVSPAGGHRLALVSPRRPSARGPLVPPGSVQQRI